MRKKLSILIALVLMLSLSLVPAVASAGGGVSLAGGVYTNTLTLENKGSDWQIIPDEFGGTLGYNPSGPEFVWGLEATVPDDGTYALIYYADYTGDRFGEWGGDNPGAVISNTIVASGGVISTSGSINLGMDLPCPPDANQFEHDYSGSPDFYDTAHGAKIWLVPVEALSGGALPVVAWPPTDNWLFETDLIWYDDTDVVSNVVAISVAPTAIDFGILTPGQTGDGGTVTVTNSGDVPIGVTATVGPSSSVFAYLLLDDIAPHLYTATLPLPTNFVDVGVELPVPSHWTPTGPETGTLTFIATVTP